MANRRVFFGVLLACTAALLSPPRPLAAQSRVGKDSATRWTRFGRDLAYGAVVGLGYASVDQWRNSPPEWGSGWPGYGRRAASNVGEFVIQEGVTEGLAAYMNRPLDYTPCKCRDTDQRIQWALRGAYSDQLPNGRNPVAVPRIVGAYVGAGAQAAWRPNGGNSPWLQALVNGTISLAIGAGIDLYYEFRHNPKGSGAITSR